MRTFWLSFTDPDRPTGQQFLGVTVVDVTKDDIAEASILTALNFPNALEGAGVIAAAVRKAHLTGCNPGGQVATAEITDCDPEMVAKCPRHRLMSKVEMTELGIL